MKQLFCSIVLALFSYTLSAQQLELLSPDQKIKISITDDKHPSYQVTLNNQPVIDFSRLGLRFKKAAELGEGFKIKSFTRSSANTSWELPWGERTTVIDHHNELAVTFSLNRQNANLFTVRFKAFNDGIGFRYEVNEDSGLNQVEITKELTEFAVNQADKATAWWIPARQWNRYEYVYNTTKLTQADMVHTPFTFKLNTGTHISIHEAALVNYAGMSLKQARPGTFNADLAPLSDGTLVKTHTNFKTPWRTIQISENATGLLNSDLILNLNEPNKLDDISFIEPGKYVGIWWGMHIGENTWASGDKHGATTAETIRYMDFAAKYGFDGVLVEGWNIGWDGSWYFNGDLFNFTKSFSDFDLKAVSEHGKTKNVRLIGHHETSGGVTNYRNQIPDAYALYQKHGVRQVKTGYVADGGNVKRIDDKGITRYEWHDSQFMVNEYLYSVTEAAKYQISINTHEPIKDTGLRRTYPNWLAREGARGQEFNAWGTPPNPAEHTAILPYTRMLSGPMDFTPGIFNLGFNGLGSDKNRPQTTLAKQLALYVVLYSPIQMAADLPRNYEANLPAFQFITDVTTDWQQSIALDGEIGEYVIYARQAKNSEDWFVGGLTDENARDINIDLSFLTKNKQYVAQIYRDGKDADWIKNPYDMIIEEKPVTAKTKLVIPLATSGGVAIRLKEVL